MLQYSSLIGGSTNDETYGITVDSARNVYVTGFTDSPNFPIVNQIPGACQGGCGASRDVFVSKINAAGSALVYSSLIGGSSEDRALGIAVDSAGNAYLTGFTDSPNFPIVNQIPGACNGSCGTDPVYSDAFVIKINATGSSLVYSSRLGGSGGESGAGIAVDSSGNAYVAGGTGSFDFPTVNQIPGACEGSCSAPGFVTKINAAGSALVYSSLFGGSEYDGAATIAVDSAGNAYVGGYTDSSDFPTINQIPGACEGSCSAPGFVTKINAAGSALVYSSLLGGSGSPYGRDAVSGIAVDSGGNAYVTGITSSSDFPMVNQIPGACVYCGNGYNSDGFVTKINAAGDSLVYSSLLGGAGYDQASGIAVDRWGNAFVTGYTESYDFPIVNQIPGACQGNCGTGESSDAFVTKINAAGSALVYSSLIGGSGDEEGFGIAVDRAGNAYVTGITSSSDFPTVNQIPGACQGDCLTDDAIFVLKITNVGPTAR